MRGLDAGSAWTHLILGMIVGGVGAGLVNPPLASTAVGVVAPQRAGMASGINSTFRQVGTATGIALLGTLFSSDVSDRTAARARPAGRGNDHPGRLHHRPEPHPAGCGDHRVRGRRRIAGRYPQPGLRARRAPWSGGSREMRTRHAEQNGWSSPQMLARYGASARSARARRTYDRIMTDNL
jgi:hypothetical protein